MSFYPIDMGFVRFYKIFNLGGPPIVLKNSLDSIIFSQFSLKYSMYNSPMSTNIRCFTSFKSDTWSQWFYGSLYCQKFNKCELTYFAFESAKRWYKQMWLLNNKYMKDGKSALYGVVFYMAVIMKYLTLHKCFCIRLWQFSVSIGNSNIYIWHPILIGGVFCEFKIYQLLHCISSYAVIHSILTHFFCKNLQQIWCHTVIQDTGIQIKWEI